MSREERLEQALRAFCNTVEYAQRRVNPEDWETALDWPRLLAIAEHAFNKEPQS